MPNPGSILEVRREVKCIYKVQDAKFTVPIKKMLRTVGTKDLVRHVSFKVVSGETLAIMGPSGAGKTTLLELLAFQGTSGSRSAHITLNQEPMTRQAFQMHCAYVPQRDFGWWCLTCRETLEITASLMIPGSKAKTSERVGELLRSMGLESCQNTRVGNQFVKGLSGGQRRRLSLAVALLGEPMMLFLDEVTSGLDAASAESIMSFLHELTLTKNIAAVCTIHQPSGKVFKQITKLLLLSSGRVAYCGTTADVVNHFKQLNRVMPALENPADFVLEQVNKDFVEPRGVDEVLDAWEKTQPPGLARTSSRNLSQVPSLKAGKKKNPCMEVAILFKRQVLVACRDPTVYTGRMVMVCLTCLFFSVIYINAREKKQEQILQRHWLIAWHFGICTLLSMVFCFPASTEFEAIKREVQANNYRLSSYIFAQMVLQLPLMVSLALCGTFPSGFGLGDWHWGAFLEIELLLVLGLWLYESLAQLLAVLMNPALATMTVTSFWLVSFLFGGALIRQEDVPWPFRAFAYVAPYRYLAKSATHAEFTRITFEGAQRMPDGSFVCTDVRANSCFGITGEEALDSLSRVVYNLSSENTFWRDVGILAGVAILFKILFIIVAYYKCTRAAAIKPPEATIPAQIYGASTIQE